MMNHRLIRKRLDADLALPMSKRFQMSDCEQFVTPASGGAFPLELGPQEVRVTNTTSMNVMRPELIVIGTRLNRQEGYVLLIL